MLYYMFYTTLDNIFYYAYSLTLLFILWLSISPLFNKLLQINQELRSNWESFKSSWSEYKKDWQHFQSKKKQLLN